MIGNISAAGVVKKLPPAICACHSFFKITLSINTWAAVQFMTMSLASRHYQVLAVVDECSR